MTENKRFHFGYVLGDTGLIDEKAKNHKWFIENCCSASDLKKNWITVCDKLNNLADENEQLESENKELNDTVKRLNDNINELLEVDFEEDLLKENKELKEENEQLKTELEAMSKVKEAHFTKMGGFSMERDDRGRYDIFSENIIPKNSPVIKIKSPDVIWNSLIADIFSDLLTEEGG